MNSFSQRSSIPSSLVTGLIGWVGWLFIGPLLFGFTFPAKWLLLIAIVSAVAQIAILRSLFFVLQMQRNLFIGAFWGLVTCIIFYFITVYFFPEMREHQILWLLIYAYVGAPVGGFLSYFYIDDKKIFDELGGQKPDTNFGRDAHWMEPFGFGVIAYLIAFFPFSNFDLTVNVIIVGAISGVAVAGASHFSPDKWKQSFAIIFIILFVGSLQGIATGFLFRNYLHQLYSNNYLHGMIGGVITYLFTFIRGKQLAMKEEKGEF
jgi:hypothetical protein